MDGKFAQLGRPGMAELFAGGVGIATALKDYACSGVESCIVGVGPTIGLLHAFRYRLVFTSGESLDVEHRFLRRGSVIDARVP